MYEFMAAQGDTREEADFVSDHDAQEDSNHMVDDVSE